MSMSTFTSKLQTSPVLSLKGFGLGFHERIVLKSLTLEIPARGCTVLLGPSGTGKSSLVRTLAGFNDNHPGMQRWGEARYADQPLSTDHHPALVMQKAQLLVSTVLDNLQAGMPNRSKLTVAQQIERIQALTVELGQQWINDELKTPVIDLSLSQQRAVAMVRELLAAPSLLMVDEPTTGMSERDAAPLIELIQTLAKRQAILVVLHHQGQARAVADHVVLIASGLVQERGEARSFFQSPQSEAARQFLRTGSCPELAMDTPEHDEQAPPKTDDETAASAMARMVRPTALASPSGVVDSQPADPDHGWATASEASALDRLRPRDIGGPSTIRSAACGPRGFVWLLPGQLGGTPWPGIVREIEEDMNDLRHVGVTRLVNLTEQASDSDIAARYGITCASLVIADMHAPTVMEAAKLCSDIDQWLANGEVVALHCRAGLGRTGTLLASYWLWRGDGRRGAVESIEKIRQLNQQMIQSQKQVGFLAEFALRLNSARTFRPAEATPL